MTNASTCSPLTLQASATGKTHGQSGHGTDKDLGYGQNERDDYPRARGPRDTGERRMYVHQSL